MKRLLSILVSLIIVATFAVAATIDKKGEMKDMEETMTAKAIFAGGCFWCMEPPFEKLDGVHAVVSGYIDGHKENPTYQEVSAGTTGHTEAVEITYDPGKISFAELLEVFWMNIDPTDAGGQFVDRGSQYRTGIYDQHYAAGVYRCAGCGLDLYASEDKFDSGTGWPSFTRPVAEENIATENDFSFFMKRTELLCARCGGHLGHVFDDGPQPTGMRHCINSLSLTFIAGK